MQSIVVMDTMEKQSLFNYCGSCKNFIGGGDFGLCCTKHYDLCYALDETGECKHYEYDKINARSWLHQCPHCGKVWTYFIPFQRKAVVSEHGDEIDVQKVWYCQDCDLTIKLTFKNANGDDFVWEANKDNNIN